MYMLNNLGAADTVFNPPDYWTTMINDPTQPPATIYPGGGGGGYPYGLYPGQYYGQRTFTTADAQRQAKERYAAMIHRAETSRDPSHRYLTAEGRLDPGTAAALRAAKMSQKRREDPMKKIQKRVILTVLIGSIVSALLK
jgi:hypothetical protein